MTPEERKHTAASEISAILERYGCAIKPLVKITGYKIRELLPVLQIETEHETQIIVISLDDWTPQNDTPAGNASTMVDSDNHE